MPISSYEKIVIRILNKEGIPFEKEKTFPDLHHGYYRYDFYLPTKKIFLEVNGEHHYHNIKKFYKSRSDFTKAQERDRRKIGYALAKGIPLYCIPYWDIDSLTCFEDLIKDKYLARSKFHNDIVYSEKQSNLR